MKTHSAHVNDLSGKQFGKWTVIEFAGEDSRKNSKWLCKCGCGTERIVSRRSLVSRESKSCGCAVKEMDRSKENNSNYKHGMSYNALYHVYTGMKDRCTNTKACQYPYYGGRGIKLCEEWADEKNGRRNFFEWAINSGYKEGLSIDRIDVNGDYSPENCHWTDKGFQSFNQRKRKSKLGVRGVYFRESTKRYLVSIGENGKQHYIGSYKELIEAIKARQEAEMKYYGKIMSD